MRKLQICVYKYRVLIPRFTLSFINVRITFTQLSLNDYHDFCRAEEEAIHVSSPMEDCKNTKQKVECKHNHKNNNKKPMVGCFAFGNIITVVTRKDNKVFS